VVGADTEGLNSCIARLTGVAIPQHDSGHATTADPLPHWNGVPVNLPPAMQDLFRDGVVYVDLLVCTLCARDFLRSINPKSSSVGIPVGVL